MTRARAVFRTGPLPTSRVEAFSDGVLAVVITLLVLDIKLPSGITSDKELWIALRATAPVLTAWIISFAFVLTFWVSHHYFFASLKNTDRGLLWLNGLFLLSITMIPLPTGLVGQFPRLSAPLALLSAVMTLASLSFAIMRFYASFHARLLRDHIKGPQVKQAMIQSGISPLLYAVATGLAFVWPPATIAIQVAVLALFFLRTSGHHQPAVEHAPSP